MPRVQSTQKLNATEWEWAGAALRQLRERWGSLQGEKNQLAKWVEAEYSWRAVASRAAVQGELARAAVEGQPMTSTPRNQAGRSAPRSRPTAREQRLARAAMMIAERRSAAAAADPSAAPATTRGIRSETREAWKSAAAAALALDKLEDGWLNELGELFRVPWDSDKAKGRREALSGEERAAFEILQHASRALKIDPPFAKAIETKASKGPGFVWPLWPNGVPDFELPLRVNYEVVPGMAFECAPGGHTSEDVGGMVVLPQYKVYVPTDDDLERLRRLFPDAAPENPDWRGIRLELTKYGVTETAAFALQTPHLLAVLERRKQIEAAIEEHQLRKLVAASKPLTEQEALRVLSAMKHWALDELPACIDQGLLTCLDSDGFVEVRHVAMQNFALKPRSPVVSRPSPTGWFSPIKQPERAGNWAAIWATRPRNAWNHPFEVRVSDTGQAELSRLDRDGETEVKERAGGARSSNASLLAVTNRLIPIAEAALVIFGKNRSSSLLRSLRRMGAPIIGPKRGYMADYSHLLALSGKSRRRFKRWADEHYPAD